MKVSVTHTKTPFTITPVAKGQRPRACVRQYQLNEQQFNAKTSEEQSLELIEALATVIKELTRA